MHPLLEHGRAHADVSLVALGPDGRILAIDAVGAGWLGVAPEAVVGQGPWVFGGLVGEKEWPATWARLEAEGRLLIEGMIVGPGGQAWRLALQLSYVPDGHDRGPYVMVVAMRHAAVGAAGEGADGRGLSRLNYASAFIGDPLFDWNVVTDELIFNAAAARLMGVAPGTQMTGSEADVLHPEASAELAPAVQGLLAGERDQIESLQRVVTADGAARDCLVRMRAAARRPDGRALRVVIHVVDVTRQQEALTAAREQQELFAAVAHTSAAAIVILDPNGQIVFANARAEQVLGLSRSQVIERTYDDPAWRSTAPDGGPWPDEQQPFVRVMTSGAPVHDIEHAIEWPDGTRRQLSVSGEPLFGGEGRIDRVLFTVHDITERVEAAERLAGSERRLREVLDRLSIGVHLLAADGRLLFSNRAATAYAEFEVDRADGRRLTAAGWQVLDADGRPLPFEQHPLQRALKAGEGSTGAEVGIRRDADSPIRWFRVGARPRTDAEGAVVDVVAEMVEITDQRALSTRLREARRLEAIGRLAGGVAHDFNNLLTVILSEVEVIGAGLGLDDPLQVDVGAIRRAGGRGAALVQALLGYARRQFRQPRSVTLQGMIDGIWRRWCRRAGMGLDGHLALRDGADVAYLDPNQFEQVFEALLDNAADAMHGVGRLQVRAGRVTLADGDPHWPMLPAGAYIRLAVSDSGPGVPTDVLHRIFEPFFSTRGRGMRAGLGLANAHGILRQNGGDVRLACNGPTGATFEVLWPFESAPGG